MLAKHRGQRTACDLLVPHVLVGAGFNRRNGLLKGRCRFCRCRRKAKAEFDAASEVAVAPFVKVAGQLFCENGRKADLRAALAAEGLRELPYRIDHEGAKVLVNF